MNKIEFVDHNTNTRYSLSMDSNNQISIPINHSVHDTLGNTLALTGDGTVQLVAGKTYLLKNQDMVVRALYSTDAEGKCDGVIPDFEYVHTNVAFVPGGFTNEVIA